MKIWVIGRAYPLPKNQLQGSFELEQAKMLTRYGHEISYLALVFHPFRNIHKWGMDGWNEENVNIVTFCALSMPGRFRVQHIPYRQMMWRKFLLAVEKETGLPDIIHIHYPSMLCEPKVLEEYQKLGVKIVSTEHWSQVLLGRLRPYELARLKWHMQYSDGVAAVGTPLATSMQKLSGYERDVRIIPNVVNPVFQPCSQKAPKDTYRFITIGRLVALRQYDKVISAFDDVFHGRLDVTLTLVGSGREYKKLKQLIQNRNAQNNIFLAGIQTRGNCAKMAADSDCLVCYSQYETFGVPVIEAWASGTPVIVSDHLGFLNGSEGDKLGLSADANDIESLKTAMQRMYEKANDYNSEYISKYAQQYFSEDAVYKMMELLYADVNLKNECSIK